MLSSLEDVHHEAEKSGWGWLLWLSYLLPNRLWGEEGFIRLIGVGGGGMAVVTAAQLYLAVIEEERKKPFPIKILYSPANFCSLT